MGGGEGGGIEGLSEEGEGVFGDEGGTEVGQGLENRLSCRYNRRIFVIQTLMSQGQNPLDHSSHILFLQNRHADLPSLPPSLPLGLREKISVGCLPPDALSKGSGEVREEETKFIRPGARVGGMDIGTEGGKEGKQVLRGQRTRNRSVVLPPFLP